MKVTFKYGIGTFNGKIDNAVFWPQKSGVASIMRKFTYPTLTSQNTLMGKIGKNLAYLWSLFDMPYKKDLKTYAERYYVQYGSEGDFDPARSPYAFYTKMMWAWAEEHSDVDLKTLTMEDLALVGAAITTVRNAINGGFLRPIDQYDDLTNPFNPGP